MLRHLQRTPGYLPALRSPLICTIPRTATTTINLHHRNYSEILNLYADDQEDHYPIKQHLFHQDLRDSGPLWKIPLLPRISTTDIDIPRAVYHQDIRNHGPLYNNTSSLTQQKQPNDNAAFYASAEQRLGIQHLSSVPVSVNGQRTRIEGIIHNDLPVFPFIVKYGTNEVYVFFTVLENGGENARLSREVVETLGVYKGSKVVIEGVEVVTVTGDNEGISVIGKKGLEMLFKRDGGGKLVVEEDGKRCGLMIGS